jgi:CheY-like chemotaxis protein
MATILVVDDRPINRQFLVSLLEYYGHRLMEAEDGAEALKLVESERPQLIITDVRMPGIGGQEFVGWLKDDPRVEPIPVIFYTGAAGPLEADALKQQPGVFAVLFKPTAPEIIVDVVHRALGLPVPDTSKAVLEEASVPTAGDKDATGFKGESESHRMTALVEASLDLASERDPLRLLEALCTMGCRITGAQCGAAGVLAEDGRTVRHFFSIGFGRDDAGQGAMVPPQGSILPMLFKDRRAVRQQVVSADQLVGVLFRKPPEASEVHGFLAVPLVSMTNEPGGSKTCGWLAVGEKQSAGEFSLDDERMVLTLSAVASVVLETAFLFEAIQRSAAELEREVQQRRRTEAELERSNADLERFAGVVSHNLQEPLRAVAGFTRILAERYQGKLDRDADRFISFAVAGPPRA